MNKTAKTILLLVGILLIAYGIYKIVTPDVQGEVLGMEFSANDNEISTESIVLIALGILALLAPRFIKSK